VDADFVTISGRSSRKLAALAIGLMTRRTFVETRRVKWLAWSVWAVASTAIAWSAADHIVTQSGSLGEPWYVALLGDLSTLMLAAVGLVIALRRPGTPSAG
jgi:hypothetical protein